jgi:YVTN family beta-propeller protein
VSYNLGIDIGTSSVVAAVADGGLEVVPLVRDGEATLAGPPSENGDVLPALLQDVLARVTERRGSGPEAVALTYPATWDADRRGRFENVATSIGLQQPMFTTEAEAAATHYASGMELGPGAVLAVYDLGGSTFDATVLRRTDAGFEVIGTPERVEGVAGRRFDDLVLGRVNDLSYGALDDLETADPEGMFALNRLRQECTRAKETLSTEMQATISVSLPNQRSEVQLTRGELDMLIQAPVESTIDALDHALQVAGASPGSLSALLLVGGSSRIPLVAQRLAEAFGRPILLDAHPEHAVALGAAVVAQQRGGRIPVAAPVATPVAASLPPEQSTPAPTPSTSSPVSLPSPAQPAEQPAPVAAAAPIREASAATWVPTPADIPPRERPAARMPEQWQAPVEPPAEPQVRAAELSPVVDPVAEASHPAPTPTPEADPGPGHGPVVVPTQPRRAQRVTVVPARGGRAGPVAAPSGGEVSHQPFAGVSSTAAAGASGPAPASVRAPEQQRPAAFAPNSEPAAPVSTGGRPMASSTPPPGDTGWRAEGSGASPFPGAAPPGEPPPGQFGPLAPPPRGFSPGTPARAAVPPGMPPPGEFTAFGPGTGAGAPPRPRDPGGFPSPIPPPPPPGQRGRWRLPLIIGLVVVLVAGAGVAGYLLLRPSHGASATGSSGASSASSATHASTPASASAPSAAPSVAAAVPIPSLGTPIDVGQTPNFVVASPSGRQLYVASTAAGVVTVVDTAVNKVTGTIRISAGPPQFLAFSPDGRKVYVSVWNTARTIAAVSVLDTTSNAIIATIPVHTRPYLAAVSPDGTRVYVPNHDTGTVSVIDATTNKPLTDFTVPANPHSIAFSPDGKKVYIADHESNVVSVVDTSTNKVITTVPVPTSPHNVAVHRTLPLAIVCSYDAKSVSAIDTNTNKVIRTIPVGVQPQNVVFSADGRFAYVTNDGSNTVSVINVKTLAVTATIPTGAAPTSTAVLPDGRTGYVSNVEGGTLTVLNLAG